MTSPDTRLLLGKLHKLHIDLVEQAFVLDRQGSLEAADVALMTSARVGELCEELNPDFSQKPGPESIA
ncbi:MAG TPA: hypothetical protein VK968_01985 [Roseimicrobium sp.]|nr:hypothetical protein [Roseimicrobium sp.]